MIRNLMAFLVLLSLLLSSTFITGCATDSRRDELLGLKAKARQAYMEKDWVSAGHYYLQLTKETTKDPDSWYWLGNTYARLDQPTDAILAYREALVRDKQHSRAWHNLAIMHLRQSAAALLEMQKHISQKDPLFTTSEKMTRSVFKILGTSRRNKADTSEDHADTDNTSDRHE